MTLLATGGAGALYARTTNPPGATGDGIAIAYRAGADGRATWSSSSSIPTALAAGGRAFLISEARARRGRLPRRRGRAAVHARRAPRRRAGAARRGGARHPRSPRGGPHQLPDAAPPRPRARRVAASPTSSRAAPGVGSTSRRDPIPVAPAAHYLMGGIATDLDAATSIPGLFAAGECACTGAHGANRLASNSLLECFVFAHRAVAAGLRRRLRGRCRRRRRRERPHARAPLAELRRQDVGGRRAGARRGGPRSAAARGSTISRSNPVRVATLIAGGRARAAREPRRAPAPRLPRPRPEPGRGQRVQTRRHSAT